MHWLTVAVWAACVCAIAVTVWYDRRKMPRARTGWAVWPDDERDLSVIARYARALAGPSGDGQMDDRTWTDLNMDDVFRLLDRAESRVGQQVLYRRLRSAPTAPHLDAFERLVARFASDETARTSAGTALRRMRSADAHDLWWLAQPGSFEARPWHVIFPILAAAMAGVAVLAAFNPLAVVLLVLGSLVSLGLRATAAADLRVAAEAFRGVEPLLAAADTLRREMLPETETLTGSLNEVRTLARLRRVASWVGRDPSGALSGELSSTIFEYLNLLFALDGNALYFGARELGAHGSTLIAIAQAVGEVDAARSIASYRAATTGWSQPTSRSTGSVVLENLRHPLVPDAVPNTVTLGPPHGVILTGSNMSGKTTFLRTLGVNVTLAQTVHTCLASRWEAPPLIVRSCIGRGDDPASGRSYYLVEVRAVLDLVAAAQDPRPHLFLFDELFRGTNTVERIAAGEAVLAALVEPTSATRPAPHIVVAATHDLELVDLLADRYAAFHFTDHVGNDGLEFDYHLRPGPANTRNAIALLGLRGAPATLVTRALARAGELDGARWRSSSPQN
jgi:hypothetical protein